MDLRYIRSLIDHLDAQGILFERGLTDDEVDEVESTYAFRFPPDLRKLLQQALPASERFPNWRRGPAAALRDSLDWPARSMLLDVREKNFWQPSWGPRPEDTQEAVAVVRSKLRAAPPLVPIFGHRYIPADPRESGNPVFSVVGSDIIYAGADLPSYFATEFGVPCPEWAASNPRPIAFWDDLVS